MESKKTYFHKLIDRLKDNKFIAYVLVFFTILIFIGQITDAFKKIYTFKNDIQSTNSKKDIELSQEHNQLSSIIKSNSLQFAAITGEESVGFLAQKNYTFKEYPFKELGIRHFVKEYYVTGGDIAFDVTLINSTSKPVILSEYGLRINKVAEVNVMPLGEAKTLRIKTDDKLALDIPDIYAELGSKLDYRITDDLLSYLVDVGVSNQMIKRFRKDKNWLMSFRTHPDASEFRTTKAEVKKYQSVTDRYRGFESELFYYYFYLFLKKEKLENKISKTLLIKKGAGVNNIDRYITEKFKDPIYLKPGSTYRYTLLLNNYITNTPNFSIIQLMINSSAGLILSDRMSVSYMVVRYDRGK